MALFVKRAVIDGGKRVVIVKEGNKWLQCVSIDVPIHITKLPKADLQKMQALPAWYATSSIRLAAEKMLEAGERLGITHGAARILKEAIL